MGRVYKALLKSGQWNDQPGSIARPAEEPMVRKPAADAATVSRTTHQRKYPAPVLVRSIPEPVGSSLPARTADAPTESREEEGPDANAAPVKTVASNVARLSVLTLSPQPEKQTEEDKPDAEEAPAKPVASNVARLSVVTQSPEPKQSAAVSEREDSRPVSTGDLFDNCPVVRIGALSLDPHLAALGQPGSLSAERFQALAVRVFNLAQKRGIKSLLVTSALEAEGKTTIATGLAALMAHPSDRKVLLADFDLRRPSAGRSLGVAISKGSRDVLAGRAAAGQCVVRLEPVGLYILAGSTGTPRGHSVLPPYNARDIADQLTGADLFASSTPEHIIRELERHFSLVVIDAPAMLDCAESQRLASIADATLIVTCAGQTRYDAVCDAVKLVPKDRRLGIVLNECPPESGRNRTGRSGGLLGFFGKRRRS